jgi:hypothetical protein
MPKQIANIPLKELIEVLELYMDQQEAEYIWDLVSYLKIRLRKEPDVKVSGTLKNILT